MRNEEASTTHGPKRQSKVTIGVSGNYIKLMLLQWWIKQEEHQATERTRYQEINET